MSGLKFPNGFYWGASTSSHQVEGGNDNNDWSEWEKLSGKIRDGSTAGKAAHWWTGKAESDLTWAAAHGQNAHRMSLEWSRLEPHPGTWNESAFQRYRAILSSAREQGLMTMVTLNHFTLPIWIANRGGWLYPELPLRFENYARKIATELGDLVDYWVTINEPAVLAYMAYAGDRWPPGRARLQDAFTAMGQQLAAHARAYTALHERLHEPQVGLVVNMPLFEPDRSHHPLDQTASRLEDYTFNELILRALATGRVAFPLSYRAKKIPGLRRSFDFLGLNYYGRFAVRFSLSGDSPFGKHVQSPTTSTEWNDWGQPCPRGLQQQLMRLSKFDVPLFVTENGLYDNEDKERPQFLVNHVRAVFEAIAKGADVRGYFFWSLVDNFEWAEGWLTHFGLLALDRETGDRRMRRSAHVFAEICKHNGLPSDLRL